MGQYLHFRSILAAFSLAAVIIGILAFSKNDEILDVAQPKATLEIYDTQVAGATDSPVPILTPTQTPEVTETPAPTVTPSPKREGESLLTLWNKEQQNIRSIWR